MPLWHICKLLNANRVHRRLGSQECALPHWLEQVQGEENRGPPVCLLPLGNICAWQAKAETGRLISKSIKGGLWSLTDKGEEAIFWVGSADCGLNLLLQLSDSFPDFQAGHQLPLPGLLHCPPPPLPALPPSPSPAHGTADPSRLRIASSHSVCSLLWPLPVLLADIVYLIFPPKTFHFTSSMWKMWRFMIIFERWSHAFSARFPKWLVRTPFPKRCWELFKSHFMKNRILRGISWKIGFVVRWDCEILKFCVSPSRSLTMNWSIKGSEQLCRKKSDVIIQHSPHSFNYGNIFYHKTPTNILLNSL